MPLLTWSTCFPQYQLPEQTVIALLWCTFLCCDGTFSFIAQEACSLCASHPVHLPRSFMCWSQERSLLASGAKGSLVGLWKQEARSWVLSLTPPSQASWAHHCPQGMLIAWAGLWLAKKRLWLAKKRLWGYWHTFRVCRNSNNLQQRIGLLIFTSGVKIP